MSQDTITCAVCGKLCGNEDGKGHWYREQNKAVCERCLRNLCSRFAAFFGVNCYSRSEAGLEIEWEDVAAILNNIKRDSLMRCSFITTDKEMYERTVVMQTPITE